MTVYHVNTPADVVSMLDDIKDQPTNPPSLYLDVEGVSLSRHGSISIIQLFNAPQNHVYLIDIFVLQQVAFDSPNLSGTTLRSIFEAETIPKVFFDVRNDSDALFAHFHISLRGTHDVQLLKAATQPGVGLLPGLGRCIERDALLSVDALKDWQQVKQRGKKLFSAKDGGSYEVFNVRPMLQDIVTYCAQDVVHLPFLWTIYKYSLSSGWLKRVEAETVNRIVSSQAESYEPSGDHKVRSPWAKNVKGKNLHGFQGNPKSVGRSKTPATENERPKERISVVQLVNTKVEHPQAEKLPSVHSTFPFAIESTEKQDSERTPNLMAAQLTKDRTVVEDEPVPSHTVLPIRGKPKPKSELMGPSPKEKIETRASERIRNLMAAKLAKDRTVVEDECIASHTGLPVREKTKAKAKPTGKILDKKHKPVVNDMWICTTCSREMSVLQKEAHLAGKAHVGRVKQVSSSAGLDGLSLPGTGAIDLPQTARLSTTKKGTAKAKAKAEATSEKKKSKGTDSKGTQHRPGAAVTSTCQQSVPWGDADWGEADWGNFEWRDTGWGDADCRFVGFAQIGF